LLLAAGWQSQAQMEPKSQYGQNIIAFHPVSLIASNFVGLGASYERLVNPMFGIKIPFMVAMNNNYYNIGLEAKLYPSRNTGPVKYAIAPCLMFGMGTSDETNYIWSGGSYIPQTTSRNASHFGFLLNQTLNITISHHYYIGADGGIGINYYDQNVTNTNGNTHISFAAQLHVAMGYRF